MLTSSTAKDFRARSESLRLRLCATAKVGTFSAGSGVAALLSLRPLLVDRARRTSRTSKVFELSSSSAEDGSRLRQRELMASQLGHSRLPTGVVYDSNDDSVEERALSSAKAGGGADGDDDDDGFFKTVQTPLALGRRVRDAGPARVRELEPARVCVWKLPPLRSRAPFALMIFSADCKKERCAGRPSSMTALCSLACTPNR